MAMRQFKGIQHIPRLSDLSVVTCEYRLVDIDVAVIGSAFKFWEARNSSIDFPFVLGMTRSGFLLNLKCGETLEIPTLCLTYHHQS